MFESQKLFVIICTIFKAVSFHSSRNVLNFPSLINLFVFCTILILKLTFSTGKIWYGVKIKSNLFDILQHFLDELDSWLKIWQVGKPETRLIIFLALSKLHLYLYFHYYKKKPPNPLLFIQNVYKINPIFFCRLSKVYRKRLST